MTVEDLDNDESDDEERERKSIVMEEEKDEVSDKPWWERNGDG